MQAKAILLARVSSKSQEDEGYSLDSQIKLLRDYCAAKELHVIREFRITETASKQQRRTVFQEMLKVITKDRVFHLVVEKTDRLTRNLRDAAHIDDWLESDERRTLHLVKEGQILQKNSRSDTKFMWSINLALAKKYTDNLREEVMKGWAEKLAQGWLPAPPPPGYMTITEAGKRIHVPNPDTKHPMIRVFELYTLPDQTIEKVMLEMAAMGLTTRSGRQFVKSSVAKILSNPFYIGINRLDGKEYPGAQEPIISQELFDAVQAKLHRKSHRAAKKNDHIFKGLIYCRACAGMITWEKQKAHVYGYCQRRLEACRGNGLREDRVERQVIKQLEKISDPKGVILKGLKEATEKSKPSESVGAYRAKVIESLKAQLDRIKRIDDSLYEDKLAGEISQERYENKTKELGIQAAGINDRLQRLLEAQGQLAPRMTKLEADTPIVRLYINSSPAEKRVVLCNLFSPVVATEGNLSIEVKSDILDKA